MTSGPVPPKGSLESRGDQTFPALDAAQVARVAAYAREESFDAGALVWEWGDPDVPFYVVLDGQLEIVHPDGAAEHPVTVHQAGQFTGEMSLLFGRRTLVRGRART